MSLPHLEKSILRTLTYFDILDYPLTATEVWKWMYKPEGDISLYDIDRVADTLENSKQLRPFVTRTEGFYHKVGREYLVRMRKRRNNRVDGQMKKAVRITKLLRLFPEVRMVAIASSLSIGNVKRNSDIDLFIITRKNKLWSARLFTAGSLKLLRQRPDEKTTRDRICLTFFISEDALNIECGSYGDEDIVYHYYIQSFAPLYDPDGLYGEFIKQNKWIERFIPNAYFEQRLLHELGIPPILRLWHSLFSFVTWPLFHGPWSDWQKSLQMRILPNRLKSIANIDSRVIISDQMLKFHAQDNRHELYKKWSESMNAYE